MGHAPKRLYSTASKLAISPTSLTHFPPRDSFKRPQQPAATAKPASPQNSFDADAWASLQPPPKSALSAFSHRIGLGSVLTSEKTIQQACVHPSFLPFHKQYYPKESLPPSNAQLASMGNSLMGLFASEHLHATYPHLPLRVLKAAVSAHVGPLTCASVAQEMGAAPLLRWHRQARPIISSSSSSSLTHSDLKKARDTNTACTTAHRCPLIYSSSNNRFNIPRTLNHRCPQIRPLFLSQSRVRHA
jgi:large subunit ribosomal protein L44